MNITSRSCGLLIFVQVVAVFFCKEDRDFSENELAGMSGLCKKYNCVSPICL